MKRILLVSLAFLLLKTAYSQSVFQKTYSGLGPNLCVSSDKTLDGGYIIAGNSPVFGPGQVDIYLIKTNSFGDTLWTKAYGTSNYQEFPLCIRQTKDSGYIVSGLNADTTLFYNSPILLYIDKNGNFIWGKSYDSQFYDTEFDNVIETNDGGFAASGFVGASGELIIMKTNSSGNVSWVKKFSGASNNEPASIIETTDNGFAVVTQINSLVTSSAVALIRMDSNGDTLWTKGFEGIGIDTANDMTLSRSLEQTPDGGFIFCGGVNTNSDYDMFLIKTSSTGDTLWTRNYGGIGMDVAWSVTSLNNGFIMTGSSGSTATGTNDVLTVKVDLSGDTLWTKAYSGNLTDNNDGGRKIEKTTDGGYIISGYYSLNHICLIKTDSNGISGCNEYPGIISVSNPGFSLFSPQMSISNTTTEFILNFSEVAGNCAVTPLCMTTNIALSDNSPDFEIFPNPFCASATLKTGSSLHNGHLTLNNCLGQTVKQIKNIHGNTITLSRDDLPSGLYFINLIQDDRVIATRKVLIGN